MASKLVDYLNEDLVSIMESMFDRGKTLHDYKITGNKYGCTIIMRLTDHAILQPKFILGKSPARQQRDITRLVDHFSTGTMTEQQVDSGAASSTPYRSASVVRESTDVDVNKHAMVGCDSGFDNSIMGGNIQDNIHQVLSVGAKPFYPQYSNGLDSRGGNECDTNNNHDIQVFECGMKTDNLNDEDIKELPHNDCGRKPPLNSDNDNAIGDHISQNETDQESLIRAGECDINNMDTMTVTAHHGKTSSLDGDSESVIELEGECEKGHFCH